MTALTQKVNTVRRRIGRRDFAATDGLSQTGMLGRSKRYVMAPSYTHVCQILLDSTMNLLKRNLLVLQLPSR